MPVFQTLDEAAVWAASLQAAGKKLVHTNGVFDFLHAGHVDYLQKARELGDALIVSLNPDASVRRLKGATRPINPEADRAAVLAALGCVDAVVFYANGQDTPTHVIEALKPAIHAKGGDYTPEAMPETPAVRAGGGEVRIIPLLPGYSNSSQFARIARANAEEQAGEHQRPDFLAGSKT